MASPAKTARLAAEAAGYTEVYQRGRGHLVMRNPVTGKYSLDTQVGNIGWHYGAGLEVDTAWEASADQAFQLQMVKAEYNAYARNIFNVGDLIKYLHPESGEYVIFDPQSINWFNQDYSQHQIAIKQAVNAQTVDDKITFPDAYGAGRHWQFTADTAQLQKLLTIDSPLPAPTVTGTVHFVAEFSPTMSAGLSFWLDGVLWTKKNAIRIKTGNYIECKDSQGNVLFALRPPTARDSANHRVTGELEVRRQGGPSSLFITVRVPYEFFQTATYPVYIDPTVDAQVSASINDSIQVAVGENDAPSNDDRFGVSKPGGSGYYEYVGAVWSVTIPDGVTIDTSYVSWKTSGFGEVDLDVIIDFHDTAAPANFGAFGSLNGISGRTGTTNSVAWNATLTDDAFNNSPSINSIIQELEDSYDYSGGSTMMCRLTAQSTAKCYLNGYLQAAADAAKLHIEYTESAGGATYEDALSITKELKISDTNIADLVASLAFIKELNIQNYANAIFEVMLAVSKELDISIYENISIETLFTLAKELNISLDEVISTEATLLLTKELGISVNDLLDIQALITLNKVLDISILSNAELQELISLSKELFLSNIGGLVSEATVSLSKIISVLLLYDTSIEEVIQLTKELGVSIDNNIDMQVALTLNKILDLSLFSDIEIYELLSLSKQLSIDVSGGLDLQAILDLSKIISILTLSEIVENVYEVALTLVRELGINTNISIDMEGNITLNKVLDFTSISQAELVDTIELIKSIAITNSSNVDFSIQLDLEKSIAISVSGGLSLEESISLGENLEILITTLLTKEESLSIGKSLDISTVNLLDANGQIVLAEELGIDANSIVTFETFINLDKTLLLEISAGISFEDAINIGLNLGIALISEIYIVPISVLGTVEINDQKYYLVRINDIEHNSVEISG